MKKNVFIITGLLFGILTYSQVGINTPTPQATLDVTAKTTDGTKPEGFIPPRLTGDQIKSGDTQYGTNQKGSIVYATTAVTTPSTKTNEISSEGYYFFDGSVWKKLGTGTYTGSTSVSLSGNSFQRAALTGDVTAALNNNSTIVTALQGRPVSSTAPTSGQTLKWNGTNWIPSTDDNTVYTANNGLNINSNTVKLGGTITEPTTIAGLTATNKLTMTATGVDAINFDSNTLSIDATNNRVGIGTNAPSSSLEVVGAAVNNTSASVTGPIIDFSLSNLASTSSTSSALTLNNLKDGGAYTLICTATSPTTAATFTTTGFTTVYMGTGLRVSGKRTIYSIIVAGTNAYITMAVEN